MEDNKTLYSKIVEYLTEKIEKDEMLEGEKLPTELELATLFNVSRITSKRALEELEKEKLIYRKRGSGSFVAPKKSEVLAKEQNIIAMVIPLENSNMRLLETLKGATDFLNTKGYYLTVHSTWRDLEKEKKAITSLYKEGVKGIIYYPIFDSCNIDVLYNLCIRKYPIVVIDKYFEGTPVSSVVSDNFGGGYSATKYLQNIGHKNIAYVAVSKIEEVSSLRQRYYGYCKAMLEEQAENEFYSIHQVAETEDEVKEMLLDFMHKGITAIHTENDHLAIRLINSCGQAGIKIPEELSIVGFDNLDMANLVTPSLTTIEQGYYLIGKRAAEVLLDKLEGKLLEEVKEVIPIELIERNSCKKI